MQDRELLKTWVGKAMQEANVKGIRQAANVTVDTLLDASVMMLIPIPAKELNDGQIFTQLSERPFYSGRWDISYGRDRPIDNNLRVLVPDSEVLVNVLDEG